MAIIEAKDVVKDTKFTHDDYVELTVDHIINWCKANGQVEWLKATAEKTFPTKKPIYKKENGKCVLDETGKRVVESYKETTRDITFVEFKSEFYKKFFPSEVAVKDTSGTFKSKIRGL